MSEPGVLVLPEVSIEGRRAGAEPAAPHDSRTRLTNRAAGLLRDRASSAPTASATGGFATERTAQDEAEVAAAQQPGVRRSTTGELDARAADRPAAAPAASSTGGFTTQRTAHDDAEARTAAASAVAERTTTAAVDARTAVGTGLPTAPGGRGDLAAPAVPAPSGTGGFETRRTAQDEAETARADAPAPRGTVIDLRTGVVVTTGGPDPSGIRTPDQLVAGVRAAGAAIVVQAPEPTALRTTLAPTVAAAQARRQRGGGGGGPAPRARPVDPIAIDPVPTATKAMASALAATLPALRLPALAAPPAGVPKPVLHESTLPRLDGGELATTATDLSTGKPAVTGTTVTEAEKRRRAKAKASAKAPVAVTEEPAKPLDPPVLLDVRRPPQPPLPAFAAEHQKGQIARVLGIIAATVPARAKTTVQAVRDAAFDDGKMADSFTELTEPWRPELEKTQNAKLLELATAAGLSVAELEAAAQTRRDEIAAKLTHQVTAAELDASAAAEALTKEELKKRAATEKEERRQEARRVQRLQLALHSHDPALVDELVTERLTHIGADVASGAVAIDAAAKRRTDLLTAYLAAYVDAYRRADDAAQTASAKLAEAADVGSWADEPPAPVADWTETARQDARVAFAELGRTTTTAAAGLVTGLTTTAEAARAALREWREKRLRRVKHAEHEQLRAVTDHEAVTKQVEAARAQATRDATKKQLVGEISFVAEAARQKQLAAQGQAVEEARRYTDEQKKVADAYLSAGQGDPFVGVAEAMASRQQTEEVRARAPKLRQTILGMVPTTRQEAITLGNIYFPKGGDGLVTRIRKLKDAFDGPGTTESVVYDELGGLSGPPMALLNTAYAIIAKENLQARIKSEMSGAEQDMAIGLAGDDGGEHAAESRQLHAKGVIADSDGIFSNDTQRALDAIRALPPGEAQAVADDPDTKKHLKVVLAGDRFDYGKRSWVADTRAEDQLQALLAVNKIVRQPGEPRTPELRWAQARADAIEMDRYVRRGTAGDPPDVEKLFARIRADVLADPESENWSAEEVDREIRRRTRDMEHAYQTEFGSEMPDKANAMRSAMAMYMWGTNKQIATDLLDVNTAGVRATKLQKTTEGTYTSDSEMNTELGTTYAAAMAEVQRSRALREEVATETRRLLDEHGFKDRQPDPRTLAAYRREAQENIARTLAQKWFADVDTTFGKRYADQWGGDPKTALHEMITDTTQFGGEREALDRLKGGGGLTAAQSVKHGVTGWGLEKDQVMAGIGGRTKEQLARIGAEYETITGGENMRARLQSETGGWEDSDKDTSLERDAFDFREALRGVATTPEEEMAFLDRRKAYEESVYFAGNPQERQAAVGAELADLQDAHARATAAFARYQAAKDSGDPIAIANTESGMRIARDGVDTSADHYREAVDAYVERAAQIAAIAAAVLVTVVTWGAAGPLVIALAASVAGTVASMATKQGILGSAYSRHAVTNDFIVGVVDAIVTVLTARLGNVLLRLPKPTGTGRVLAASIKAIETQKLAKPLLARVGAFAAEQVAQSAPSAVTGALLDRSTWKGDPVRNVAKVAGFASAVGIGVGGVMHGVTTHGPKVFGAALDAMRAWRGVSGADIAAERVMLRSTAEALARGEQVGDVLAHRGTPAERLAAQREYLKKFPDRTPADFQAALREGTADAIATADAHRALRRDMMTELLDGIPSAERRRFLDTKILVLSDADFVANTGSRSKGNAATLILHGEPVVVVREGAPLSSLREEGMHVRQAHDVINAEKIALLDESKLAGWKRTSLEDRVAAWHAKLDLELEVQARTIADLDSRLEGVTPERAATIMRQYDDARAAYDVLSHRRRQLLDLDDAAMARIRGGQEPAPHFLAEEPRLFSKSKAPPDDGWVPVPGRPGEFVLPPTQLRQPGPEFKDVDGRRRRWVREWDPLITDFRHYEQVWSGTPKKGRWVMHGDAPRWSGGVGEIAMRLEHTRMVGTDSAGVHRVQLDAQRGQGTGFDDVMPEFRTNAAGEVEATIVVYEAKYYRKSAGSFTAIDDNFRENLSLVKERLEKIRDTGSWEAAGMSRAQLDAALTAVDSGQIRVVVRTADSTTVSAAKLKDIQKRLRRRVGARVEISRGAHIDRAGLVEAEDFWMQLERYRLDGYPGMVADDAVIVQRLAAGSNGVTPASLARAEAVLAARQAAGAVVGPDVRWDPSGRFLVSGGNALEVVVPTRRPSTRFDHNAEAQAILARAGATVQPVGAAGPAAVHVVVDASNLSAGEVQRLIEAMRRLGRRGDRSAAFGRTIIVNRPAAVGAAP